MELSKKELAEKRKQEAKGMLIAAKTRLSQRCDTPLKAGACCARLGGLSGCGT